MRQGEWALQFNIDWLLSTTHPAVRCLALTELLDLLEDDPQVIATRADVLSDPWVMALFSGQQSDGTFTHSDKSIIHPYNKWMGAHWRLVSLVELGIPAGEPRAVAAIEGELSWLTGEAHRSHIPTIDGRTRRCASQEGNALAVSCRLGLASDPRVVMLAKSLVAWQWPDGGWNCDKRQQASHSSFHEFPDPFVGSHRIPSCHRQPRRACRRTAGGRVFLATPSFSIGAQRRCDPSGDARAALSALLAL